MAPSSRFTNTADCLMMTFQTLRYDQSARRSGMRARGLCASLSLLSALVTGCATGPTANANDPLEPLNRAIFTANDTLDEYLATPLAKGYKEVTPQPVRTGITNVFANLSDVGNTVNSLLQADGKATIESFMRVFVNTIFGIGGVFDLATPAGIEKHPQDFGLTLGSWGVESGPYLVLPLFGPSSFRDSMSQLVDYHFDPVTYMPFRKAIYGMNFVSTRTNMLGATDLLSQAALDRYTFVRDAYLQQRRYLLREQTAPAKLPEYDDYGDTEAAPAQPGVKQDGQAPAIPPAHEGEGSGASGPANLGATQDGPVQDNLSAHDDNSGTGAAAVQQGEQQEAQALDKQPKPDVNSDAQAESATSESAAPTASN